MNKKNRKKQDDKTILKNEKNNKIKIKMKKFFPQKNQSIILKFFKENSY